MSSTETSINIKNAFDVVRKTYTNVNKLFAAIDIEAKNNGLINIISGQRPFVRYKSDIDTGGWLINYFIKLYQRIDAPAHSKIEEMKLDDSIYGITISFELEPKLIIARYSFEIEKWNYCPPVSDDESCYWPIQINYGDKYEFIRKNEFVKSIPKNEDIRQRHRLIRYAIFTEFDLVGITSKNLKNQVFEGLNKLPNLEYFK